LPILDKELLLPARPPSEEPAGTEDVRAGLPDLLGADGVANSLAIAAAPTESVGVVDSTLLGLLALLASGPMWSGTGNDSSEARVSV
jgi:hypothetical protein